MLRFKFYAEAYVLLCCEVDQTKSEHAYIYLMIVTNLEDCHECGFAIWVELTDLWHNSCLGFKFIDLAVIFEVTG